MYVGDVIKEFTLHTLITEYQAGLQRLRKRHVMVSWCVEWHVLVD